MPAIEYFPGPFDEVATKLNGGGKKDLIVQDMYICTPCNVTTNQYQMYIYFGKHHVPESVNRWRWGGGRERDSHYSSETSHLTVNQVGMYHCTCSNAIHKHIHASMIDTWHNRF